MDEAFCLPILLAKQINHERVVPSISIAEGVELYALALPHHRARLARKPLEEVVGAFRR